MKKRYYIITALIAYAVFMIAGTPASSLTPLLEKHLPQLRLAGVSGTLWRGHADSLQLQNGETIEQLGWSFNGWRLLVAEPGFDIESTYREQHLSAQMGVTIGGYLVARKLVTRIDAGQLADIVALPFAELSGSFAVDLEHLYWKRGEVPRARGQLLWHDAGISVAESVRLGMVDVLLDETGEHPLSAAISNRDGELDVSGTGLVTDDGGYTIALQLTPAKNAGRNLHGSLAMIARKQPDGSYSLDNSGNLKQLGLL